MRKDVESLTYQPGALFAKLAFLGSILIGFVYTFMWMFNIILKAF